MHYFSRSTQESDSMCKYSPFASESGLKASQNVLLRVDWSGTHATIILYPVADVLSEEAILKWYREAHSAKGKSVFLEQMSKFVEWLLNAEEGTRNAALYFTSRWRCEHRLFVCLQSRNLKEKRVRSSCHGNSRQAFACRSVVVC